VEEVHRVPPSFNENDDPRKRSVLREALKEERRDEIPAKHLFVLQLGERVVVRNSAKDVVVSRSVIDRQ
jgi:hypothetical protein